MFLFIFSTKKIFTHIFVPTFTFCGQFFLHFQLKVRQQFASPWTPSHYWWSPHSPSSLPTPPSLLLILYFHWFLPFSLFSTLLPLYFSILLFFPYVILFRNVQNYHPPRTSVLPFLPILRFRQFLPFYLSASAHFPFASFYHSFPYFSRRGFSSSSTLPTIFSFFLSKGSFLLPRLGSPAISLQPPTSFSWVHRCHFPFFAQYRGSPSGTQHSVGKPKSVEYFLHLHSANPRKGSSIQSSLQYDDFKEAHQPC